ncbi:unnamed protein product [Malus baccata var. baccata]
MGGASTSLRVARPPLLTGSYVQGTYDPVLIPPGVVPIQGWSPYSLLFISLFIVDRIAIALILSGWSNFCPMRWESWAKIPEETRTLVRDNLEIVHRRGQFLEGGSDNPKRSGCGPGRPH